MSENASKNETYLKANTPEEREEHKNQVLALLLRHQKLVGELAPLVQAEKELRQQIFSLAFTDPVEGTNSFDLNGGYVLKGKHTINRTLDEAQLATVRQLLEEEAKASLDDYVRFKPDLKVGDYKKADPKVKLILDMAITAKPGMPAIEIVLPKR